MRVQRVPADDLLVRDGETAILLHEMVMRLSELSSVIYALTENPIDVGHLARELESRLGAPEGVSSRDATGDAVAQLIRHGVLTTAE